MSSVLHNTPVTLIVIQWNWKFQRKIKAICLSPPNWNLKLQFYLCYWNLVQTPLVSYHLWPVLKTIGCKCLWEIFTKSITIMPFATRHILLFLSLCWISKSNATSCCHVLLDCSLLTDNNKLKMTNISWCGNVSQAPPDWNLRFPVIFEESYLRKSILQCHHCHRLQTLHHLFLGWHCQTQSPYPGLPIHQARTQSSQVLPSIHRWDQVYFLAVLALIWQNRE